MKSTERGDKCRQRPWGLVCHFSICLNSCSWSRAKGDKRIQQLNHSYCGNHCFVVFFFFFSSFFCFRTSRSKGAGYVTGCSANYFIAPACWALLQWKHLKFCPWSRELDHTTVLLWNFFFFFCGRSFKVRENAMSRQQACHLGCLLLLFEHKAYLASTDGCSRCWDCRLPASRHCSLKASVSNKYRLKPEESRIVFITAL